MNCCYARFAAITANYLIIFRTPPYGISVRSLLHFYFLSLRRDYLKISDGSNRRIGTYCDYETGKSVRVVGRTAVLKFVSNRIVRYQGFTLSLMFTPKGKFRKMSTVSYEVIYCGRPAIPRQQSSIVVLRPID